MCHSLPQYYLADTPEVQEAKRAFAVAYNEAVRRGGSPAPVPVPLTQQELAKKAKKKEKNKEYRLRKKEKDKKN